MCVYGNFRVPTENTLQAAPSMESSTFSMWPLEKWLKHLKVMLCLCEVFASHPIRKCCWLLPMMATWNFMMCKLKWTTNADFLIDFLSYSYHYLKCHSFHSVVHIQTLPVPYPVTHLGCWAFHSLKMENVLHHHPAIKRWKFGTLPNESVFIHSMSMPIKCGALNTVQIATKWFPFPKIEALICTIVRPMSFKQANTIYSNNAFIM